ncbi:PREDICTED: epidermal growth factor receptor substrate 15-like 1 [Prunus mume]|uniref:Epidermal growth factor receptor substrate 15-like 1 n=1 Tax=Prunus mume TaxID=102107 RepID=A0ABM0P8C8_PRUMU|nr:PREDICTED: epidermal growth factor receptor substrate 15-like 1 [Prunus mume]
MASAQNQSANVDLFDAYFRRADLDRDGRISGSEAVAFFQASGLPKPVLAQIWAIADQRQTSFLGRAEFYNALRLVTVAQSKRELTPEIVKAALYGPAAAKIPAPQINLAATAAPQFNSAPAAPATQGGAVTPTSSRPQVQSQFNPAAQAPATQGGAVTPASSQTLGFRGPQVPPSVNVNQQNFLSQDAKSTRPPVPPSTSDSQPPQGVATQGFPRGGSVVHPHPPNSSMSNDWIGGRTGGAPTGIPSTSGPTASLPPRPQAGFGIRPSGPPAKDSKSLNISGNGFTPDSSFGDDVFSATASQPKQNPSAHAFPPGSVPVSSTIVPAAGTQSSASPTTVGSLQSSHMMQQVGGQPQQAQSFPKPNQQVSAQTSPSGVSLGAGNSASSQSHIQWPRMTQNDAQKYSNIFVKVDTDRDGKITGEQARDLFLKWGLPREVLKQVWDLSDQDNDSMLSLREFCAALYLMERYREGRPLPAVLPNSVMFDLSNIFQPTNHYNHAGNVPWRPASGVQQQQPIPGPGARHMAPPVGGRPPKPVAPSHADERPQTNQQKPRVPELEKHLLNQLSKEEINSLELKFKEATEADKKVEELEKEILDAKEKIEYFRVKMQELVLYKSRCDNRLNEITERASADKREAESLAKKYEEKYKQTGDVASKLTIEEATFRDLQEKKMELYRAIVKMEQGGDADGTLQDRVDRIQLDLDELVKTLNERCKKYGLRGKPTTLTELPFGWQLGIQEGAADWDEDWDKFEDEGFTVVKELTLDVPNVLAPPKQKSSPAQKEKAPTVESPTAASSPKVNENSEKPQSADGRVVENGAAYDKNENDSAKSAPNSPLASSTVGSPSREFSDSNFGKTTGADASPREKEFQSDHGGPGSVFGDKNFDEPAWGTFDTNDDVDSVWGFNAVSTTKDIDQESNRDHYFSGPGEFGLNPIRTGSSAGGFSQNNRPFTFDDSVPSTPLSVFNSGYSPPRYKDSSEPSFDTFSRFDSFRSTQDSGFFPQQETLGRFDSMRSSRDFDQGHGFPTLDDIPDPFGSSAPFRTSLDSQTPRRDSDPFGSSGPFRTSWDSQTPRRDSDPFGSSAPFRTSLDSQTPRRDSDTFGSSPFSTSLESQTPRRDSDPFGSSGPFKLSMESQTPRRDSDHWSAF